ncbi:hypothetical protein B0H14DRAFT_1651015 [Mycena olivaceomarginata]|nr:hypothetical protein B0H14DRAFT_1651015 [Mycena olivaceomarginata]
MQALVTQASGLACLVKLGSQAERRVGQSFSEPDLRDGALGAVFAADGKTVVFGNVDNCLLVWDALKGAVLYGMEPQMDDMIQRWRAAMGRMVVWWRGRSRGGCFGGRSRSRRSRAPRIQIRVGNGQRSSNGLIYFLDTRPCVL